MEQSKDTELLNGTTSGSRVGGEDEEIHKFSAAYLMNNSFTEVTSEAIEYNGGTGELGIRAPLLVAQTPERMLFLCTKKTDVSVHDHHIDMSLSIDNLLEMNGAQPKIADVKLVWRNLSCSVKTTNFRKKNTFPWLKVEKSAKTILQEQSGSIKSGVLTAVIGPSGAGKSTFLECLSGKRRTNRTGEVYVSTPYSDQSGQISSINDIKQFRVSFISQKDYLIGVLTVRESLLFASKLKNYNESYEMKIGSKESLASVVKDGNEFHSYVVETIISQFGLEGCSDTFVSKCSGGQAKRLSIALELVSTPRIIILDEPTSGLDSSSALQVVQVLKQLTKSKLVIVASIHQPSARLLNEFDNVYILSKDGRCLYHGPVENLLAHFSRFKLYCAKFHNPADFVMEVAAGTQSSKSMDDLAQYERIIQAVQSAMVEQCQKHKITNIVDKTTNQKFPTLLHAWLLLRRTWLNTIRDPILTWLRLFNHIAIALVASYMYNFKVGEANGCPVSSSAANATDFFEETREKQQSDPFTNVRLLFFIVLFLAFANSSATCLTFPLEMSVFIKERRNGWYSCGTYFMSKLIADTPFQIGIPLVMSTILYTATGQPYSPWRWTMFSIICIVGASIAQGIGILFGILFLEDVSSAVFTAVLTQTPFFLLGGFIVKYSGVRAFLKPIAFTSYVRYCFESLVIIIYGFDRCEKSTDDDSTSSESSILQYFELNDKTLWTHFVILLIFLIALRIGSYFLLLYKANKKLKE